MSQSLLETVEALPSLISLDEIDDVEEIAATLHTKIAEYEAQATALYILNWISEQLGPEFQFSLSIDQESGTYYLYTDGVDGVVVDEDDFEDDHVMQTYCEEIAVELEGFAQQLNDSVWRENKFTISLIKELNDSEWERDQIQVAIQTVMDKQSLNGGAFIAAINARKITSTTPEATHAAPRRPGL